MWWFFSVKPNVFVATAGIVHFCVVFIERSRIQSRSTAKLANCNSIEFSTEFACISSLCHTFMWMHKRTANVLATFGMPWRVKWYIFRWLFWAEIDEFSLFMYFIGNQRMPPILLTANSTTCRMVEPTMSINCMFNCSVLRSSFNVNLTFYAFVYMWFRIFHFTVASAESLYVCVLRPNPLNSSQFFAACAFNSIWMGKQTKTEKKSNKIS